MSSPFKERTRHGAQAEGETVQGWVKQRWVCAFAEVQLLQAEVLRTFFLTERSTQQNHGRKDGGKKRGHAAGLEASLSSLHEMDKVNQRSIHR